MRYKTTKGLVEIFIVLFITFILFTPETGFAYNKSWDQGHQCTQAGAADGSWGWYAYDTQSPSDRKGKFTTKECCEIYCRACPVYVNTGRLQKSFSDLSIPGVGPALNVVRTYQSQDWATSLFGRGWVFNYGRKIIIIRTKEGDKQVVVRRDTGEINFFKEHLDGSLELLAEYGVSYQLTKKSDGTYVISEKNGKIQHIGTEGKLISITDKNDNQLTFQYNSVGCLNRITNASGNFVEFQLGPNGKIASITDNFGRSIQYSYDLNGNLISSTDPLGNTTQYNYDSSNRLTSIIDPRGNTVFTVTYDTFQPSRIATFSEKGETWTITYYNGYTVKTDSSGNAWTYYYNGNGIITKIIDPLGNSTEQNLNNVTATSMDWEEDLNGNRTTYTYDQYANVTSKTDPLGNTWIYTYTSGTNLIETETNPLGVITKYEYDNNGNQTKIIRDFGGSLENTTTYTYDSKGNMLSETDPLGNTTNYEYDGNGNLIKITDPLGNDTAYTYDSKGNKLTETDALGNTTTYTYDLMDRLVSVSNPLGNFTAYTYDTNGNQISVTDANGNTTTYTYDAYNRLVQETDPLGNVISYAYDYRDNLIIMTDGNGNPTTYTYNILNRLISVTNAIGGKTNFMYDGEGNILSITDANGNTITFNADALNRVTKINYPNGTFKEFFYDAMGNIITVTDQNGNSIKNIYDSLDRLTIKTYPDYTTTNFTYDVNDNIISANNSYVSYVFTYDVLNRLTQATNVTLSKNVSYSYLCNGLKSYMIAPEGGVTNYNYDTFHRLSNIINSNGEITKYSYDNLNRIIKKNLSNGTYTSYSYDSINRLLNLKNITSTDSVISSYSYTYDNTINRTSMTTLSGTYHYSYDKIYQLLKAIYPNSFKEEYTYDPIYNRLTSVNYNSWTYDNNNRLISYNGTTYTYDANGNTISKKDLSGITNYQYDYENRLIRIDYPDGTYSQYSYDPFGNRIKNEVKGIVTWFLYDLTKELPDMIAEYNSSGFLVASYTHGPGIDDIISVRRDGNSYYYLKDGLGSIVSVTDKTEAIVNTYQYDAFGNVINKIESIANQYGYTGRVFDSESSLMFYRARYYDVKIGRFITADPIGFSGGINFYVYVQNNPINNIDPGGLKIQVCCRLLQNWFTGTLLRQRHCYIKTNDKNYALFPQESKQGTIGVPTDTSGDPFGRPTKCAECPPLPDWPDCDTEKCLADAHKAYPIGRYFFLGPNSNTYAGTLARKCCKGGVPKGLGSAPGINDQPPAPITN